MKRAPDHGQFGNPIRFLNPDGSPRHQQPESVSSKTYYHGDTIRKGKGVLRNGTVIHEPMDFTYHNAFPLKDQHQLLRRLFFPNESENSEPLRLTPEDREFVIKVMGQFPRECHDSPDAGLRELPDAYVKNFLTWCDTPIRPSLRCYNKGGEAYGYLTDNAYIVDRELDVEFFLAAAIHTNANQIYNDDTYEYDTIGKPFLAALGKAIYHYERQQRSGD